MVDGVASFAEECKILVTCFSEDLCCISLVWNNEAFQCTGLFILQTHALSAYKGTVVSTGALYDVTKRQRRGKRQVANI